MAPLGNRFGLHLSAIGHTAIQTGQAYPPGEHPSGRAFSWEKGRIIHALQLVAIREGAGQIEWMREQQRVRPGTAFILKPGDWHRYRPDRQVGWTEDWFEIRGELVDHWLAKGLFEERFYKLEDPGRFFMQFDAMHEAVHTTGMIPEGSLESRACGLVAESQTGRSLAGKHTVHPGERERIAQARRLLTEGHEIQSVADQLKVSYQSLYRSFKQLTGLSPKQFSERARLARAEGLLAGDQLSVKEIAHMLGYHSASHFSLAYKSHYGRAPAQWRAEHIDPNRERFGTGHESPTKLQHE